MDAITTPTCDKMVCEETHYEPTFTEGQVRKFPRVLLNGMREQDVDGKWWVAVDDSWLPYGTDVGDGESVACDKCWGRCEDGKCNHCEDSESECDCGESDCDKEHVCECCQQETDYDDLYKCDDCSNLYCDECGTGKGGQCKECESDSDEDEEDDEEEKAFQKELKERPCSDCGKDCHGNYSLGGIDKDGKMRKACMPCKKKDWEAAALKYKK